MQDNVATLKLLFVEHGERGGYLMTDKIGLPHITATFHLHMNDFLVFVKRKQHFVRVISSYFVVYQWTVALIYAIIVVHNLYTLYIIHCNTWMKYNLFDKASIRWKDSNHDHLVKHLSRPQKVTNHKN